MRQDPEERRNPENARPRDAYLAALWGLEPIGEECQPPTTSELRAVRQSGEVVLGRGPRLRTSTGSRVRLPDPDVAAFSRLEAMASFVLKEGYRGSSENARRARVLGTYYALRPLLPRWLQVRMRRIWARGREKRALLDWPADGLFVSLAEAYLALRLLRAGDSRHSIVRRWPEGSTMAAVLTHDVEGTVGQDRCNRLAELEERFGVRSCFNFVAERYPLDHGLMQALRARGFEIGLHGIKHDGKKFSSRAVFEERLQAMRRYRESWRIAGFRSPATHRRWEWMAELPFLYDSSYPDSDPYEPMPGGCASPWPFPIGPVLELPITLPQDHTLWEILRRPALPVWKAKLEWLHACGGLANIIVHPDYLESEDRWKEYADYISRLRDTPGSWIALPREVAAWWCRHDRPRQSVTLDMRAEDWSLVFD